MSSNSYNGDGVQTNFTITYDYIDRDFIQVYVGSVLQTEGVDYSFASDTVVNINPAPPSGTNNVELRRVTSTTPVVDFSNGASLTEDDLDNAFRQPIHIAEEAVRDSIAGITLNGSHWDADARRITNVAAPVVGTDVATQDSIASQVAAASASETSAAADASSAAASAATAAGEALNALTARTFAEAARTGAEAARDEITGIYPVTGMTQHEVLRADGADSVVSDQMGNLILTSQGNLTGSEHIVNIPANSFDHFVLELRDFAPSDANANLCVQFSIDGGSTYENAASDYEWVYDGVEVGGGFGSTQDGADSQIDVARRVSNSDESAYLIIDLFCGDGADKSNAVLVRGSTNAAASLCLVSGTGRLQTDNTRVTNVRLFWEAGETFSAGTRDLHTRITW